ncbi:carbamoyltransferase [Kitasatospora phosalacinea]|uniref:carbamoyltransferase family protein n=1 Tax=Kitasatospora phosalacinea TaxID=2065 RepID=UPI0035DB655C
MSTVLGISVFYHDSAAALLVDGRLVAAAQEERFSRRKHDPAFPAQALRYVLGQAPGRVDAVAYYESPWLKRRRVRATLLGAAPHGRRAFDLAVRGGLLRREPAVPALRAGLRTAGVPADVPLLWSRHHLSHAASAYYPSPFDDAAVLTADGVGEHTTTGLFHGRGSKLRALFEQRFPHSLGLLYSGATYFCGFKVDSGEYKLMGLTSYGDRAGARTEELRRRILDHLIDLRADGSFALDLRYFAFHRNGSIIDVPRWERLFEMPRRTPESGTPTAHADLALAFQQVAEEVMLRLARLARRTTEAPDLCLAGGVALNCVANTRIAREAGFDRVWVQPAAGDAGGAVGAAYAAHHLSLGAARPAPPVPDGMSGAYLGPDVPSSAVEELITRYGARATRYDDPRALVADVAADLAAGRVVGWVQGRMEFGPRALGNRSILADPRNPAAKEWLNARIKAREDFRPFAPSILAETAADHLAEPVVSPYMTFTTAVRTGPTAASAFPAAVHVDGTARHHTVDRHANPRFHRLLAEFHRLTGCPALVNTSFNVRGEPIVATAEAAYRCFLRAGMDRLVLGEHVFRLEDQTADLIHPDLPLD